MPQLVWAFLPSLALATRKLRLLLMSMLLLACTGAYADRMVLLVDNSGSMRENDIDRLVLAGVVSFIESLPPTTEVAIVSFDARGRLIQPLIPAAEFDPTILNRLDSRGPRTDLSLAVERGLYELRHRPPTEGHDAILMITDGIMDTGSPEGDLRAESWLSGELTQQLVQRDITMWVVALSEEADFRILNPITRATGGDYLRAMTASEIRGAIERIRERILASDPRPAEAHRQAPAPAPAVAVEAMQATPGLAAPGHTAVEEASAEPAVATRVVPEQAVPGQAVPRPAVPDQPIPRPAQPEAEPLEEPVLLPTMQVDLTSPAVRPDTVSAARWWLAAMLLLVGAALLGWAVWRTWLARQPVPKPVVSALEYFPDCYLVDLHGVTNASTLPLKGKYNMITRLQQPPDDGIHYIQIFRRQIGRRHALIEYRDFSFWVIDQQSMNGTFLNGKRVTMETRLKHGDRLRFYKYEFEYCVSDLALSNETMVADDTRAAGSM